MPSETANPPPAAGGIHCTFHAEIGFKAMCLYIVFDLVFNLSLIIMDNGFGARLFSLSFGFFHSFILAARSEDRLVFPLFFHRPFSIVSRYNMIAGILCTFSFLEIISALIRHAYTSRNLLAICF